MTRSGLSMALLDNTHLEHFMSWFGTPSYGITTTLPHLSYEQAIEGITAALKAEGFGVLTEIDVKATLKKKIDADFRPYVILGACNPPIAHQALTAEPGIGLLLPCNVVVTVDDDGAAVVSAVNPTAIFALVGRPDVEHLAADVHARLSRAVASLEA